MIFSHHRPLSLSLSSGLTAALLLALTSLSARAGSGPGKTNDFGGKRVLILGIDGCRPDALQKAMAEGLAPHLKAIFDSGTVTWTAVAGGIPDSPAQQQTISGAGWTSICTGVWIDKHHVRDNATPPINEAETPGSWQANAAPHFATRLKAAYPQSRIASIVSWKWIEDYLVAARPQDFADHEKGEGKDYAARDEDVKNKAVALLGKSDPDVLFLHFDQADGAGHATGFSPDNPAYLMAIRRVDGLIGEIQTAVTARPGAADEKWLTVVTTDHGGKVRSHGGQSPEERTIFFAVQGPDVPAGRVLKESPGHTAVPPTVFKYLGVPVDSGWGWVSQPFGLEAVPAK